MKKIETTVWSNDGSATRQIVETNLPDGCWTDTQDDISLIGRETMPTFCPSCGLENETFFVNENEEVVCLNCKHNLSEERR